MTNFLPLSHKSRTVCMLLLSLALLIGAGMTTSVSAQVRGTTTSVNSSLNIMEDFNGIALDPTPNSGSRIQMIHHFSNPDLKDKFAASDTRDILADVGIGIPGWLTDLIDHGPSFFCSPKLNPYFEANAGVDLGVYYEIKSVGNADVAIRYPVTVNIEYPAENTFACGDTIRISTTWTVQNPGSNQQFKVTPPFFSHEIGPLLDNLSIKTRFGISASAGIGIRDPITGIEACIHYSPFNEGTGFGIEPNLPTIPPFVDVCEGAFGPNANINSLIGCEWSPVTPYLKDFQFRLNVVNGLLGTNYNMATFPDTNTVNITTPDFPSVPGIPPLPETQGTFKRILENNLSFSSMNSGKNLKVSAIDKKISDMDFDLVSLIDYSGVPTSLSLGSGLGSIDIGDLAPTLTVKQDMEFDFNPVIAMTVDLGMEMEYWVHNSDDTQTGSGFGRYVQVNAGQYIMVKFPQNCSSPSAAGGSSKLKGNIKSEVNEHYWAGFDVRFGEVHLGNKDIAIVNESLGPLNFSNQTIINHTLDIESNSTYNLSNFTIDPENPIINIESGRGRPA